MRSATDLLRVLIEFVFILLGALILWVAVSGRYFFDRRAIGWIALGAALFLFGVRGVWRSRKAAAPTEDLVRGLSHVLVGLMMLGVAALPFRFEGPLLGTAGAILMFRGLANAVLVLRGA